MARRTSKHNFHRERRRNVTKAIAMHPVVYRMLKRYSRKMSWRSESCIIEAALVAFLMSNTMTKAATMEAAAYVPQDNRVDRARRLGVARSLLNFDREVQERRREYEAEREQSQRR